MLFLKNVKVIEWIPGYYPGEKTKTAIRNKNQKRTSTTTLPTVQNHMLTVGLTFLWLRHCQQEQKLFLISTASFDSALHEAAKKSIIYVDLRTASA